MIETSTVNLFTWKAIKGAIDLTAFSTAGRARKARVSSRLVQVSLRTAEANVAMSGWTANDVHEARLTTCIGAHDYRCANLVRSRRAQYLLRERVREVVRTHSSCVRRGRDSASRPDVWVRNDFVSAFDSRA